MASRGGGTCGAECVVSERSLLQQRVLDQLTAGLSVTVTTLADAWRSPLYLFDPARVHGLRERLEPDTGRRLVRMIQGSRDTLATELDHEAVRCALERL